MKKSNASAARTNTADLEFPDWSGMDDSTKRVSVETAFRLCEEYYRWFPASRRARKARSEKCTVEFSLE
jgi:hypothetical protein